MTSSAIVSPNCRIRYPEAFHVGDNSIVDDFGYFSTRVEIGVGCHVASGVTIAGGKDRLFKLGDYSGVASGVRIYCTSNDYVNELVTIGGSSALEGDVIFENYTGVGANTVVLPNNVIPEGTVIGALSFVPANFKFEPWSVYFGNPLRYIMPRNRDTVLEQVRLLRSR